MNVKLETIKKSLTKEKKEEESIDILSTYIFRPLSFYLTYIFLRFNISANDISFFSVITAIITGIFIAIGNFYFQLIGCFLFIFWIILDGVDGNIARITNTTSLFGEFADAFSGYTMNAIIYVSVAIAYYYDEDFYIHKNKEILLILGSLTSILSMYVRLLYQKFINTCGKSIQNIIPRKNRSKLLIIAHNISSIGGIIQILLFLTIVFKLYSLFIIWFFILNIFITLYTIKKICKNK